MKSEMAKERAAELEIHNKTFYQSAFNRVNKDKAEVKFGK